MSAQAIIRIVASLALLGGALWAIDTDQVVDRLSGIDRDWLIVAIALTVPQTVFAAWRWRVTALRLSQDIPLGRAVGEYYAATFLNQTLPGGVPGDAVRAWRQGRAGSGLGAAVRAVAIERLSGQIMLVACLLVGLAVWPAAWGAAGQIIAVLLAVLALAITALWVLLRRPGRIGAAARTLARDCRMALLSSGAWRAQIVLSALVTAGYLAGFWAAGRAIGVDLPAWAILTLVPTVLLSMLVPLSVGGWGLREATAAVLWPLAGLVAADGVTIAAVYGATVLVGSLPGALPLLGRPKVKVEKNVVAHGDVVDRRP